MNIYALVDWQFWAAGAWFVVALVLSCYLPGSNLLRLLKIRSVHQHFLSLILGSCLWAIQGYVFGYTQLRWLSYLYLAVNLGLWLPQAGREWKKLTVLFKQGADDARWPWPSLIILILGSFMQLTQVFGSGLKYGSQVGFFQVNAYDGVMHLSFIQALIKQIPAQQPGAAGLPLTNYHYWSDMFLAELARVWQLPISHLFFQYLPVLLVFGTGWGVWQLLRAWKASPSQIAGALFFLYFAADLLYIFTLVLHQSWGFKFAAIDNGATQLLNIPHSFAKFLLFGWLLAATEWLRTKAVKWGVLASIVGGVLIGVKVYFGLFVGLILGFIALFTIIHHLFISRSLLQTGRAITWLWSPLLLYALISAAIFFPPNSGSGGLFWAPLAWPNLLLSSLHIDWNVWFLRKQVYEAAGSWRGIVALDSVAIGICLLCMYGTRVIGLVPPIMRLKQVPSTLIASLSVASLIFMVLGLYTLQTAGLFNVFNFFAVSAIPLALFSGYWLDYLTTSHKPLLLALAGILIISNAPRLYYATSFALQEQTTLRFERKVSADQLAALEYLRTETPVDSIIQTHVQNPFDRVTPALSFFSNRQTYLTGVNMLESHNQPVAERKEVVSALFQSNSQEQLAQRLQAAEIDYLYLVKDVEQALPFFLTEPTFRTVFENEETVVYQPLVNR